MLVAIQMPLFITVALLILSGLALAGICLILSKDDDNSKPS